jgi:hypothetical protein
MALAAKDIPITREDVAKWLGDWAMVRKVNPDLTVEDYIRRRVEELNLLDPTVDTSVLDDWGEVTHVADLIIADLPSYGYEGT